MLLPLAVLWLGVHLVLLGLVLGIKFLSAKAMLVLLLLAAAFWLLAGRKRPLALPSPPGVA